MILKLRDLRSLIGKTITSVTDMHGFMVLLFDDGSATVVRGAMLENGMKIFAHKTAQESAQAVADHKAQGWQVAQLLYDAHTKVYYAILREGEELT